jgi:hypothetical protein
MSTTPLARRSFPRWLGIAGWSVLALLGATLAVFVLTVTFGAVHGTEFCPQTFQRRTYSLYELPLIGIQVTGIRREDVSQAAELFITSHKYITVPTAGAQEDWHIITGSRGTATSRGDASILMQYLDATDSEDYHRWVKWSEEHPKLAPILWPAVQRLAEHELYIFVPDLFDLAKKIEDPVKLRQELDRAVASKLLFLGKRLAGRDDLELSKSILDEAAKLDPLNEEIKEAQLNASHPDGDREKGKSAGT